jgi:predicted RNase H-like HicB family nuclease
MLMNIFRSRAVDPDTLYALSWKKPSGVEVIIKKSSTGYFARVTSLEGNVVTEAQTGQELFEMVNEAIYDYLEIPTQYRERLGYYLPPENVRQELRVDIPTKYLNTTIRAFA